MTEYNSESRGTIQEADNPLNGKGKNRAEPASLTEKVLAFAGALFVVFGIIAAGRILIASTGTYESPKLSALYALLTGLVPALMFFAFHLVLQYLRRIVNVVEGRNNSSPTHPVPFDSND